MGERLTSFGLSLKIAESKANAREASPTKYDLVHDMQEEEIKVCFRLPDKSKVYEKFKKGQTIIYLKNFLDCEHGIPLSSQNLYLGETRLLDPLTLIDYPGVENNTEIMIEVEYEVGAKREDK